MDEVAALPITPGCVVQWARAVLRPPPTPSQLATHFPARRRLSKWNAIEHKLFSFISRNWCARPLVSLEVIVNLIASTTTRTGLEVYARLDPGSYPGKIKVADAELKAINLQGDDFHPEWNYTIRPRETTASQR